MRKVFYLLFHLKAIVRIFIIGIQVDRCNGNFINIYKDSYL